MKVSESFKDNKKVVFLMATDEGVGKKKETLGFLKTLKVPFKTVIGASCSEAFKIDGYPTVFVIGADGKIAWNDSMGGDLAEAIKKALGAVAKPAAEKKAAKKEAEKE